MIAGRPFQRNLGNDEAGAYVINQAAVKKLGFASPDAALGQSFMASYHRQTKRIIGVTENFHYRGMQEIVEPLIMDIESSLMNTITLNIRVENMPNLMQFITEKWKEHFPGVPLEYSFLDENFGREYRYEVQMSLLWDFSLPVSVFLAWLLLWCNTGKKRLVSARSWELPLSILWPCCPKDLSC